MARDSTARRRRGSPGDGGVVAHARAREMDPGEVRRRRVERFAEKEVEVEVRADEDEEEERREQDYIEVMPSESTETLFLHSKTKPRSTEGRERRRRREKERERETREERHRRRRREKEEAAGKGGEYVYGPPKGSTGERERLRVSETRAPGRSGNEAGEDEAVEVRRSKMSRESPKKIKVVYAARDEEKGRKHKEPKVKTMGEEEVPKSRGHTSSRRPSLVEALPFLPPRRSATTRMMHSDRPPLRRNNTSASNAPSTQFLPPTTATNPVVKRSNFMGSFFGPGVQQQQHRQEPERLVECLICLSDDVPRSKSAKLKCGHRMCHSCLKRSFRLSVTDPAHMPPKCCTADHIPLKHVEKLFNIDFKKNWNRKFQEFSTKNRIYCPARRCGEWIKPGNIHKEDGKKYGKCGRCRTKVCCTCNGKWHGAKDCPKDEETNQLLETAKQAGWQRCYSCRTMVELKEGCNHMTCHCTAEFCMICGLKWKTCNCPWFNYDAVEADRLNHMQLPHPALVDGVPRIRRPPGPFMEPIHDRQRQERRDEALARRLQRAALEDERAGGTGGNHARHVMNQDYVRAAQEILTGDFDQATAAANHAMGRTHARPPGLINGWYPPVPAAPMPPAAARPGVRLPPRASEVVSPRRRRADTKTAPATNEPPGRAPRSPPARAAKEPKSSVLAGLGARGNRVSAWRSHVEPGVEPEEGVLSVVS